MSQYGYNSGYGAGNFLDFEDTPNSYTGQAGKVVAVNATATGLEFITVTSGGTPAGSTGEIQFNNAGAFGADANLFWDDTNNRLGIGVNNPTQMLQVGTTLYVDNTNGAISVGAVNPAPSALKAWVRAGTNMNWGIAQGINISGAVRFTAGIDNASSNIPMEFNATQFAFGAVGAERMRIDINGNIGIGTTSPAAKLHIDTLGSTTTKNVVIRAAASQIANLTEWQNSAGTVLSAVTSAGNVGINQTTASYPLSVTGNTDFAALGPVYVRSSGGGNIGTALSLDATDNIAGRKWSFISTGALAGPGAGSFAVYNSTDSRYDWLTFPNGRTQFGINLFTDLGARVAVQPESASTRGLVVRAAASQTANLTEWQNSAGTVLASVTAGGLIACTGLQANGTNATGTIVASTTSAASSISIASLLAPSASQDSYISVGRALTANNTGLLYHSTLGGTSYTGITLYGRPTTDFAVNSSGNVGVGVQNGAARFNVYGQTASVVGAIIRGAASQTANLTEWQNSTGTVLASISSAGAFNFRRTATAANVSSAGETIIGVTSTAAARTITLSTADMVTGRVVFIKDESGGADTNNITIDTQGAELIDGAASIAITVNYGVARLYSDGSNWYTL